MALVFIPVDSYGAHCVTCIGMTSDDFGIIASDLWCHDSEWYQIVKVRLPFDESWC